MGHSLSQIEIFRSRCTGFAEDFLRDLEQHPDFPEILDMLLKLDDPITRMDIEDAFLQLRKRNDK